MSLDVLEEGRGEKEEEEETTSEETVGGGGDDERRGLGRASTMKE